MIGQERELAGSHTAEDPSSVEGQVSLTEEPSSDDFMNEEDLDMDALIDQTMSDIESGQVIKGTVLKVSSDDVVVDIGSKSEGLIPLNEFLEDGKDPNVFVGMEVDVMVVRREGRDGLPVLSRRRAKERMTKKMLRKAFKEGTPVRCTVKEVLRGGFQVDVEGVRGFIPFSQMGPGARSQEEQKDLIGQSIEAKILEMRNKRDLILSQRRWLDEKREKLRKETMESLKEGYWIDGVVKNLTDFGAFVDLGGLDGLLHVKDMSWGHVAHPREMVKVGDELKVMVLSVEGDRISLGLKHKTPDPWLAVEEKYPPNSIVGGKVTSLTKYGAFICLEDGVEGLIHISEMSWVKRVHHPSDILKEGEEVRVKVLGIDKERQRISLSLRQTTVDPWTLAKANYPTGTVIEGEITGMTDFGAFVRLPEGVDGMVHVSDLSWGEKVSHPKQVLKKGEKIRCKVLEIDPGQQRISLGLKQLEPDPWSIAREKYPVGTAVEVKVTRMTEFGAFVELEEGIEGLAHISTLTTEKGKRPEDVIKVGQLLIMKVIKFDLPNHKISLSLKDYIQEQEQKEVKKFMSDSSGGNATLGELLGDQMKALMEKQEQNASSAVQEETSVPEAAVEAEPEENKQPSEDIPAEEPGQETLVSQDQPEKEETGQEAGAEEPQAQSAETTGESIEEVATESTTEQEAASEEKTEDKTIE